MSGKILGSILILFSSIYIGKITTDKMKKRLETLKSFQRLLNLLEGEITYAKTPLDEAFSRISESINLMGFLPYIISAIKKDGIRKSWKKGLEKFKQDLALTDGDTKILVSLSHQLGATDKSNQVKNIRYISNLLSNVIKETETNYKTLTKLYRGISLCSGIIAIILLI